MQAISVLFIAGIVGVSGHGYITSPGTARAGVDPANQGQLLSPKLTPYSAAVATANAGCGGAANAEKAPGIYGYSNYAPGAEVRVGWKISLPHPSSAAAPGNMVRVAVHYGPGDSYAQNILYQKSVPAAVAPQITNTVDHAKNFKLPAGKTTNAGVIQWLWASQGDGGFYIGCTDIKVIQGYVATDGPTGGPGGVPAANTGIPTDGPTGTVAPQGTQGATNSPGGGNTQNPNPGGGATNGATNGPVVTQRPLVTQKPGGGIGIGGGSVSPASTTVASPLLLALAAVVAFLAL